MPTARAPIAPPPRCACTTLRKAARAVGRVYESQLALAGVTATQFAILRSIQRHDGPVPLGSLADDLVLERTSLYRALEPMRRNRLVRIATSRDPRAKEASLTATGVAKIAEALPYWEASQAAFLEAFGAGQWRELTAVLQEVIAAGIAIREPSTSDPASRTA